MPPQKSSHRRIAADRLRESLEMDGMNTSALSSIFKEEPPDLKTFLYDSKYLNHLRPTLPYVDESGYKFTLSDVQYDFVRNFEQVFEPELYIAMVEEFGDAWTPLPMKNMFAISWGKGSKDPNEKIYDPVTGKLVPLRDFNGGPVSSFDIEDGKRILSNGTKSFHEGDGRMFIVTTSTGRKTVVWEGHRFLAWGREMYKGGKKVPYTRSGEPTWKRLWDLTEGDHIGISSRLPEPLNPTVVPDWEVEFVGMMLGDGCMTYRSNSTSPRVAMAVGNSSPLVRGRYEDIVRSLGMGITVQDDPEHNKVTLYPTGTGRKGGNPLIEFLRTVGIAGHRASDKFIPEKYFNLSNRQIALLLSRLIDTDGWVGSSNNTPEVGYSTTSEQLADDVMYLFHRLGAVATKKVKKTKYKGEDYFSYQVRVRRSGDVHKVLSQLTLLDKEPRRVEILDYLERTRTTNRHASFGDVYWDTIESIEYSHFGEYWTMTVEGPANYISGNGVVDHNSGKDSTVRIGFARIASLLQHLHSPQSYFKMASFDNIHMLNVAVNAQQARDAFFDPMKKLFTTNKYLSEMFHGDDPAEGASRLRLKNNLTIISGHSLAENQEGLNLIAGVADEISAFKTAEEYGDRGGRSDRGADAIVGMLQSSASSRFPDTYKVAQISWPRFYNDAISKALDKGRNSIETYGNEKSQWYVSGPYATWDVNPKVSRESLQEHFDSDPEKASAMYAAKPPRSTNVFIRNETAIDAAFDTVQPEPITVDYYWGQPPRHAVESDVPEKLRPQDGWQVSFGFNGLEPIEGALYCLHGDMAIKGDRAGIAMSHVKSWRESSDEAGELPIVKNDFTFSFESDLKDPEHPREVQIRWYRQLIWELIDRGFQIATVTFDQFQSTSMIQSLKQHGIDSGLLSLDRNDKVYQEFKDIILDYRLEGYRSSEGRDPRYVAEIKRLRKTGKKVDHPPSGSKDESDALAGSVFNAITVGGSEEDSFSMMDMSGAMSPDDMLMWHSPRTGGNDFGLFGSGGAQANSLGFNF